MSTFQRAASGLFACAYAGILAGCGRFVTPVPPNDSSDLSGKMVITFRTNGAMNFATTQYEIVIDTCAMSGAQNEPYPSVLGTTYLNYSYIFSTASGTLGTLPTLYQVTVQQGSTSGLKPFSIPPNGSLESFVYPYAAEPTEFQLIFTRAQLANPLGVSMPCANQVEPSAAPGTVPSAFPTNQSQQYWYINFFTVQNGQVQDSLGPGGASDATYTLPVDTATTMQYPLFKRTGGAGEPVDPAAQISGGQIDNYR